MVLGWIWELGIFLNTLALLTLSGSDHIRRIERGEYYKNVEGIEPPDNYEEYYRLYVLPYLGKWQSDVNILKIAFWELFEILNFGFGLNLGIRYFLHHFETLELPGSDKMIKYLKPE